MSGTRLTITTGGTAVAGETAWANLLAERHEIVAERERLRTGDAELVHGGLTVVVERKCVEDWAKNHETFIAERARLCAMRSDACVPMVLMHGVRPPCDDSMVCSYGGMTGKRFHATLLETQLPPYSLPVHQCGTTLSSAADELALLWDKLQRGCFHKAGYIDEDAPPPRKQGTKRGRDASSRELVLAMLAGIKGAAGVQGIALADAYPTLKYMAAASAEELRAVTYDKAGKPTRIGKPLADAVFRACSG